MTLPIVSGDAVTGLSADATSYSERLPTGVQFRLRDNAGVDQGPIPAPVSYRFSDPLTNEGALAISLNREDDWLAGPGQVLFDESTTVEVWIDGGRVVVYVVEDYDDTVVDEGQPVVTFVGRTLGALLEAGIHVPSTDPISSPRAFTGTAPLSAWKTLRDESAGRGSLVADVSLGFDASTDSDSVAWAFTDDIDVAPGADLLSFLKRCCGLAGADYRVDADSQLQVRQTWGTDRSATVLFEAGYTLGGLKRRATRRRLRNAGYLVGKEGLITATTDAGSISSWGRREFWMPAGDATTSSTRNHYLNAALEARKNPIEETTILVPLSRFVPWVDYEVGDTVGLRSALDGIDTTVRVVEIALSSGDEPTVAVTVSTKVEDRVRALEYAMESGTGLTGLVDGTVQFPAPVRLEDAVGELTTDQIGAGQITETLIAPNSISTPLLQANAVVASKISSGAVETDKLAAGSVVADKLATGSVVTDKLGAGAVTATKIQVGTITGDRMVAGTLTSTQIQVGSLTGDRLQARTIAADRIVLGSLTSSELGANSVGSTQITANAVTSPKIVAGAIQTSHMNFGSIDGDRITAGTLSVSSAEITSLNASKITAGTMSADRINGGTINGVSLNINGQFIVDSAGNMTANAATITGTVTATVLRTAASGARLEATSGAGAYLLRMYNSWGAFGFIGLAGVSSETLTIQAPGVWPQINMSGGTDDLTIASSGAATLFISGMNSNFGGGAVSNMGSLTINSGGLDCNGAADISGVLDLHGGLDLNGTAIWSVSTINTSSTITAPTFTATSSMSIAGMTVTGGILNYSAFIDLRTAGICYASANTHVLRTAAYSEMVRIAVSGAYTDMRFVKDVPTLTGATTLVRTNTSTRQVGLLSSSIRFKKNVERLPAKDRKRRARDLWPRRFRWEDQVYIDSGYTVDELPDEYGFIAEEVAEHFPEAVTRDPDGTPRSVKEAALIAVLWDEVEDLQKEIKDLRELVLAAA